MAGLKTKTGLVSGLARILSFWPEFPKIQTRTMRIFEGLASAGYR